MERGTAPPPLASAVGPNQIQESLRLAASGRSVESHSAYFLLIYCEFAFVCITNLQDRAGHSATVRPLHFPLSVLNRDSPIYAGPDAWALLEPC